MNKHRVIGFFVIIGIIVIATEFLMNYRIPTNSTEQVVIQPPMPELVDNPDSLVIIDTEVTDSTDTINSVQQSIGNQVEAHGQVNNHAKSKQAAINAAKLAQAWVVQLASYTDQAHANKLVARLNTLGFEAFSYKIKHSGQNYIRVNAGPVASYTQAKALLADVKQATNINGYIVKYSPSDDR